MARDSAFQSHSLSQRGSCSGRVCEAEIVEHSTGCRKGPNLEKTQSRLNCSILLKIDLRNQHKINRRESSGGMEWLGVSLWTCIFSGSVFSNFLKFGENRSFCGISGIFLEISASEKSFSKWPYNTPPIHTPTKCRPNNLEDPNLLK